jgi:hypothetical protein
MCKFAREKNHANLLRFWFKQTHRARAGEKNDREGEGEGWTLQSING